MARPLLWLLFVPWTLPALEHAAGAQPEVVLLEPAPRDGWMASRAAALIVDKLESVGVRTRLTTEPQEGVYRLTAEPGETQDPAANLTLSWTQRRGGQTETGRERGDADALEPMAARVAARWAERAGRALGPEELAWIARREAPFTAQALLEAGRAQLAAGDGRRALMKLEQAVSHGGGFFPEAQRLALLAKRGLAGADEAKRRSDRELARSALERARVAASRDRWQEAIDAYRGYASYEQAAARPADHRVAVEAAAGRIWADERTSRVELGGGRALVFDDAAGVLSPTTSEGPALAFHEGDRVLLESGRRLARIPARGKPRFSLPLPEGTSVHPRMGLPVVRGFAALVGGPRLAWVDLGLGAASPTFDGTALAAGEEGLLVFSGDAAGGKLSFHRPGRHQPAFELELSEAPTSASLARGRVMLELAGALFVHDSETGRRRAGPFSVGGERVHLGAEGRYGAFGQGGGRVLMLDVLGGESLGVVEGPARPALALGHEHGLAIVFESGDLFYLDREGAVRDRARVPGRPLDAAWVSATDVRLMVLTTEGVYFHAPPNPDLPRDVDVLLELARLYRRAGRAEAALALATRGARLGAGQVEAFEALRAELLAEGADAASVAARQAALSRARAARDPKVPLPAFAWIQALKAR